MASDRVVTLRGLEPDPGWLGAADRFVASLSARTTAATYADVLDQLGRALGCPPRLGTLSTSAITRAFTTLWDGRAPRTWNRNRAAVNSFLLYCRARRWVDETLHLDARRRKERADRTRALTQRELERLWSRPDVGLRERTFWRMAFESAARASELLSLDIEDLDFDNKRARVRAKGGDVEWIFYASGTARLLPRLLSGRTGGPLFLASRRPGPARTPAAGDLCPETGRARLSYRRAEELFTRASGGWTLHDLRRAALTYYAERGVELPLLMGISRHTDIRSLYRYTRPTPERVAGVVAEHDPNRRRR